jgi:hypothetical protein
MKEVRERVYLAALPADFTPSHGSRTSPRGVRGACEAGEKTAYDDKQGKEGPTQVTG